jgi:NAD-dependent protein deacetylase/lipoamidase
VLELHGNIWYVRCTGCGKTIEDRTVPLPELPACERCGGLLRPHVVWFGEMLDVTTLEKAQETAQASQVMLLVGTSGVVQPAASMGMNAKRHGAFVAEINLEPTQYTGVYDLSVQWKAGEILPQLL